MDTSPTADQGLALHLRLLANDATASSELCQTFLEPLFRKLTRKAFVSSVDDCHSAAIDALVSYLKNPGAFNPGRLDLFGFLFMVAWRRLAKQYRRERTMRLRLVFFVENDHSQGNSLRGDPLTELLHREQQDAARNWVARHRAAFDPEEQAVLDLLLEGKRQTEVFARALGLENLPRREQKLRVKRVKDRIKKRIVRGGMPDGDTPGCDDRAGAA